MLRSEVALKITQAKELLEKERSRVWDLFNSRRAEVLTMDDIMDALHPDLKRAEYSERGPYTELVIKAVFYLVGTGAVERVEIPGSGETYFGIKL